MKVIREVKVKTKKLQIGDRIKVSLPAEKHMATAIRDEGDGMLFLFDEYLDEAQQMNFENNNDGGYDESKMRRFLQKLALTFPEKLKKRMVPFENGDLLRLLSITEMCGVDENFNPYDGQIEWMKDHRHRIAARKGKKCECGWTSTAVFSNRFANVSWAGTSESFYPSVPYGVRPAFKILY